jgi:acetyl esterase/lipase
MKPITRMGLPFLAALLSLAGGCTRFEMLNATVPSWGYVRHADIPYGDQPRQKLDVYQPDHAKPDAGVVVFFYGGDWQNGSKDDYRFAAQAFVSQGFVTVLPDYRLYPQVTFPAFLQDGAQAVRWAHDHAHEYGGDPKNLFLVGHSAGAYIVAMLALDRRYLGAAGLERADIRAAAAYSGPYDFRPLPYDLVVFGMSSADAPMDPNTQPIHFVDGKEPPMLLVQGLRDPTVDPVNATRLAQRIRDAGGQVKLITYPERGHPDIVLSLASSFRWLAPVLRDTCDFFREEMTANNLR